MPPKTPTKLSAPASNTKSATKEGSELRTASTAGPNKDSIGWDEAEEAKIFKEPELLGDYSAEELENLANTFQQELEKRGLLSAPNAHNQLDVPAINNSLPSVRDQRRRLPVYYRLLARIKKLLGDKENDEYQHILILWTGSQSLGQEQWKIALRNLSNFLVAHPAVIPLHNTLAQVKYVNGQDLPAFVDNKTGMASDVITTVQDLKVVYKEKASGKAKQRDGPWYFDLSEASTLA
jgi:hypothetical protein